MAMIQTPNGRIIGLIVEDNQAKDEPAETAAAEAQPVTKPEPPKRGRPKKQ